TVFARAYDRVTEAAGSVFIFVSTLAIIVMWAILGGVYKAPDNWQIAMQDGSSIQAYISDSLLMRQQQNQSRDLLQLISELRSRGKTYHEVFTKVYNGKLHKMTAEEIAAVEKKVYSEVGDAQVLQSYNWYDQVSNVASKIFGSIYCVTVFWICIFVWVGLGALPHLRFGDKWQLYINTATAVEITLISMFIQNIRKRHILYVHKSIGLVIETDYNIEYKLRTMIGSNKPNKRVSIAPMKVTRGERAIEYYAAIIGTGIGLVISAGVFATWIAIGDRMEWSDDWWLIIGTYTGLVGFIDGFTLRSCYYRCYEHIYEQFKLLEDEDSKLLRYLGVEGTFCTPAPEHRSFNFRVSAIVGRIFSSTKAVGLSVVVVIVLICIASYMKWRTTAQLICNTPTMIIEGFCLLVLLEGHNQNNAQLRVYVHDSLQRKFYLQQYV
ncbi:Low affinity iron permease, partial [Ascoidea rubescens DSM 1968]